MLTVTKATSQARRHVDRLMPNTMVFVESRLSHDLETDTPLVITTVSFPEDRAGRVALGGALSALPGARFAKIEDSRITLTRER